MGERFVVASQTLLRLIVRLQQVMSVAQGRAMLLDYARRSCGARLALLFTLEQERQVLLLLEHCGRHPRPSSFSLETMPLELSLHGLFASVLRQKGFVDVPDISLDALTLPEERALAWPHGRVLLAALRQGQHQGVLAFCFGPAGSRLVAKSQIAEELLIATSLLSAYMGEEEHFRPVRNASETSARAQSPADASTDPETAQSVLAGEWDEADLAPLQFSEMMNSLVALSELGLMAGSRLSRRELDRQILRLLGSMWQAGAGFLWYYQPYEKSFLLRTAHGRADALVEQALSELTTLSPTLFATSDAPASGQLALPGLTGFMLVWHLLYSRDQPVGALGLLLPEEPALSPDQQQLLLMTCKIVALILVRYDQRLSEEQALVDEERGRIAREMHDGVMQDVAHVIQKLDHVQRILEKQPRTALSEVEQARNLLTRSLRDLRYSITTLLPVPLEKQRFDEALRALLHEYSLHTPHLKITCDMDNLALWPQALQAPVYRFMQEALNNIRKHASASEVRIRIYHTTGLGIVQVSDNGQGFVPGQIDATPSNYSLATMRMGLLTMEERIRQAGGVLNIRSTPGEGTTLSVRFTFAHLSSTRLTEREHEVLHLLVEGLTNRAISENLSISLETVKSHVHHIMQKMHVKDRTQAAVVAIKQQWL